MNAVFPVARLAPDEAPRTIVLTGGHSGAEVVLQAEAGDTFVRKTARDVRGNARLRQQALKQRLFSAQGLGFPHVRSIGFDAARRATFEMDYVPARTLGDLVRSLSPHDQGAVVTAVGALVSTFRNSACGELPAAIFRDKIEDIANAAGRLAMAASHRADIARIAARVLARDWSNIPASPSHGDLTFENILVTPQGDIVFIDCDEPFASSWWLDLGKLFQDIAGLWCLRGLAAPSIGAAERLALYGRDFRALAQASDRRLLPRLAQFAALHLLRTIPYAETPADVAFAVRAAFRVLEMD